MSEKDYIEKLIHDNLEELNENEPLEGHFDRFRDKLQKSKKNKVISLNAILKVAAAVVFILLAVNQALIYFSPERSLQTEQTGYDTQNMTLSSVSAEYEEVEFYFNNAINTGMSQWEKMVQEGLISAEEQKMMDHELSEFEGVYEKLQNDLTSNPNDERVINAMLDYYQTKLSVINMIIKKLEEVKQKRNTNHEIEM